MQAPQPIHTDRLTVIAWPDEIAEHTGHDPRGQYVERYWLPVLGPTATWILRRIADELEASTNGFVMDLDETARSLGVGGNGLNSAFVRAIMRLVQFEVACTPSPGTLAVRRTLPSLSRRHLSKLPESMQRRHEFWLSRQQSAS